MCEAPGSIPGGPTHARRMVTADTDGYRYNGSEWRPIQVVAGQDLLSPNATVCCTSGRVSQDDAMP